MRPLLTRLAAPAAPPVTLQALKAHLRITEADEDAALSDLLLRATATLDGPRGALGRCLMAQTWRVAFPRGVGPRLAIPVVPATGLEAVRRIAPDGTEEALDPNAFLLCGDADFTWILALDGWPAVADRPDALSFDVTAGAASAEDVAPDLRQAILLLAGHWHAHREAVALGTIATDLPLGVQHIVDLHRLGWVA